MAVMKHGPRTPGVGFWGIADDAACSTSAPTRKSTTVFLVRRAVCLPRGVVAAICSNYQRHRRSGLGRASRPRHEGYALFVDALADPFATAKANVYSGTLDHIVDWKPGRLEKRSCVAWSSQALCVSVSVSLDRHPAQDVVRINGPGCRYRPAPPFLAQP